MINTIKETIKGILGIEKKIDEEDIECAIDEDVVECDGLDYEDQYYTGVPAPVLNPIDEWFASPYGVAPAVTEKQKDYMEQEIEMKRQEREENFSVEPDNIHQLMYEMATKSGATTIQLDPIGGSENFQGGSENVHR
jgi:hypothetical protein|tara:strand:- start:149 stop:559 length:411 start_codon:yes stop_codon:yes gene_type:complete